MKKLLLLCVVGLISGCVGVSSLNPVGTKAVDLDPDDWNGVWSGGNEAIYFIKVKDAEKGILHIGYVDEEDGKFVLNTFDAHIKSSNKDKFCNMKVSEVLKEKEIKEFPDKLKNSYYWMLVNNQKGVITIILPNADNIQKLAKEVDVKAEKANDTILIEGTSEEVTKFIQSYENGELYIWKHPMNLQRIIDK